MASFTGIDTRAMNQADVLRSIALMACDAQNAHKAGKGDVVFVDGHVAKVNTKLWNRIFFKETPEIVAAAKNLRVKLYEAAQGLKIPDELLNRIKGDLEINDDGFVNESCKKPLLSRKIVFNIVNDIYVALGGEEAEKQRMQEMLINDRDKYASQLNMSYDKISGNIIAKNPSFDRKSIKPEVLAYLAEAPIQDKNFQQVKSDFHELSIVINKKERGSENAKEVLNRTERGKISLNGIESKNVTEGKNDTTLDDEDFKLYQESLEKLFEQNKGVLAKINAFTSQEVDGMFSGSLNANKDNKLDAFAVTNPMKNKENDYLRRKYNVDVEYLEDGRMSVLLKYNNDEKIDRCVVKEDPNEPMGANTVYTLDPEKSLKSEMCVIKITENEPGGECNVEILNVEVGMQAAVIAAEYLA